LVPPSVPCDDCGVPGVLGDCAVAAVGVARVSGVGSTFRVAGGASCKQTCPQIRVALMAQRKSMPKITSSRIVGRTSSVSPICRSFKPTCARRALVTSFWDPSAREMRERTSLLFLPESRRLAIASLTKLREAPVSIVAEKGCPSMVTLATIRPPARRSGESSDGGAPSGSPRAPDVGGDPGRFPSGGSSRWYGCFVSHSPSSTSAVGFGILV